MTLDAPKTMSSSSKIMSAETGIREPATFAIRLWLWSTAGLVFLMVVVGGATRLTGSGLSITQWKPISGVLPPMSDAAWQAAHVDEDCQWRLWGRDDEASERRAARLKDMRAAYELYGALEE